MYGKLDKQENKDLKDLNQREIVVLLPIILLIFWMGIYPETFLKPIRASTTHLVEIIKRNDVKAHVAESSNHPASHQQPHEEHMKPVRRDIHE